MSGKRCEDGQSLQRTAVTPGQREEKNRAGRTKTVPGQPYLARACAGRMRAKAAGTSQQSQVQSAAPGLRHVKAPAEINGEGRLWKRRSITTQHVRPVDNSTGQALKRAPGGGAGLKERRVTEHGITSVIQLATTGKPELRLSDRGKGAKKGRHLP